jgi:hypothetical protein
MIEIKAMEVGNSTTTFRSLNKPSCSATICDTAAVAIKMAAT